MQVAFWASQEAQNEYKVQCQPLKHRFFQTYVSRILDWSKGTKFVPSAMRELDS